MPTLVVPLRTSAAALLLIGACSSVLSAHCHLRMATYTVQYLPLVPTTVYTTVVTAPFTAHRPL